MKYFNNPRADQLLEDYPLLSIELTEEDYLLMSCALNAWDPPCSVCNKPSGLMAAEKSIGSIQGGFKPRVFCCHDCFEFITTRTDKSRERFIKERELDLRS